MSGIQNNIQIYLQTVAISIASQLYNKYNSYMDFLTIYSKKKKCNLDDTQQMPAMFYSRNQTDMSKISERKKKLTLIIGSWNVFCVFFTSFFTFFLFPVNVFFISLIA